MLEQGPPKPPEPRPCKRVPLHKFVSPIPILGPAYDCVELCIYDNDGPEGLFRRLRFARSADAIKMIIDTFDRSELDELNFTLENFWRK